MNSEMVLVLVSVAAMFTILAGMIWVDHRSTKALKARNEDYRQGTIALCEHTLVLIEERRLHCEMMLNKLDGGDCETADDDAEPAEMLERIKKEYLERARVRPVVMPGSAADRFEKSKEANFKASSALERGGSKKRRLI